MHYRKLIASLMEGQPRFGDGRVDFTHAAVTPLLSVIPYYKGRILLLRRSSQVRRHKGLWGNVSCSIDRLDLTLEEMARHALHDEASIHYHHIKRIKFAEPYQVSDAQKAGHAWMVFPALAELQEKPDIILSWEYSDHVWISPEHLGEYPRPDRLHLSIKPALALLHTD